jgi:hypothetical protein
MWGYSKKMFKTGKILYTYITIVISSLILVNFNSLNYTNASTKGIKKIDISQPKSCSNTELLNLLRKDLPSAKILHIIRKPSKGTFLDYMMKSNALICYYGSQSQEIGVTVYYKEIKNKVDYNKLKNFIANPKKMNNFISYNQPYPLIYEESFKNEMTGGRVLKNYVILYPNYYIKIESSFFTTYEQATPFINSALFIKKS